MKKKAPVSVLMPVFNAEKYLALSIESILNQTYADFLFYIINDGSSDNSENIIRSYKDERIVYLKNETNKGLIYTLNKGLELSSGKYIIRMDADDISLPERIHKQVEFMDLNPQIWVSGTQIQYFGNENHQSDFPLTHDLINARMLFGSSMVHPSVIIRSDKLRENNLFYDEKFKHIEDYELWIRIARIGKLANLNDVLLKYRMDGQNITVINWNSREERLRKIYTKLINELGLDVTEENTKLHIELSGNSPKIMDLELLKKYSEKLIFQNGLKSIYDPASLKQIIDEYWGRIFFKTADNGFADAIKYWKITGSVSWDQVKYVIGLSKSRIFKSLF